MSKERNRLYEGMYIINASLSEDARNKALKKITDAIEEKKGKIHKIHEMGKRKLAYEIDKKREGFYYLIYFTLSSLLIDEIWKEYHLHEDIIRFTTLKANDVKETLEFKPLIKEK
ncbi:MAG: 30S ribosomal protein S6 [Candidatus Anoxychlamydiales bacterium]|nr:30S ribosomal protein S6 [Candidatus Anoxychlamydiales bacterium]